MDFQSIMCRDPELEASFSFSGHDHFNYSSDHNLCHFFSDLEDDDNVDADQYIEIAVEQPRKLLADHDDDDDGLELRISFSSSVPFHNSNITTAKTTGGLSRTTTVDSESIQTVTTPSSSASTSTLSCSSSDTYRAAASATDQPSTTVKRKVSRLLGSFLSINPRTSLEMVDKDNHNSYHEPNRQVAAIHTNNHLELVHSRKSPKITKTTSGGIMMKLLIKCRSINIRTLLASLMKPYQIIIMSTAPLQGGRGQKKKNRSSSSSSTSKKWLVQRDKASGERSRVFEKNMDAIKGVLEWMSITSLGRRDRKMKNMNGTRKGSSPISSSNKCFNVEQNECEMYAATADNSIHAAIAHCKTSFGQPSDFNF